MELKLPDYNSARLVGLVFLIILIAKKTLAYFRLRHFRGPPGTGLTDFFHSREIIRPNLPDWYKGISDKYGQELPEYHILGDYFISLG